MKDGTFFLEYTLYYCAHKEEQQLHQLLANQWSHSENIVLIPRVLTIIIHEMEDFNVLNQNGGMLWVPGGAGPLWPPARSAQCQQ